MEDFNLSAKESKRKSFNSIYYVAFDKQRIGISRAHSQEKFRYFLGAKYDLIKGANLSVQYGYEKIDDLDNIQGRKQVNHLIRAGITLDF